MKKFLLITAILLIIALLAAIAIFCYLSFSLKSSQVRPVTPADEQASATADVIDETAPTEGIPLRDMPLSDGQRSVVETLGVDVETFTITPEMQACAEEALGPARMQEIIAGDAPSFIETTKLVGCL